MRSGGDPSFLRLVQDLSIAVLLVLGIYLRERGSPESKPVAAPTQGPGTDSRRRNLMRDSIGV